MAAEVIQQAVEKVAIFSNLHGDIVIRQERAWDEKEDPFIIIARGQALVAAYAILEAGGEGDICFHRRCDGGFVDVDIPARPTSQVEQQDGIGEVSRPDIDPGSQSGGLEQQKPKDPTAAERMRRYRNKHRNDDRNTVTDEPELRLVNCADQREEVLHAAE